MKKGKRKTAMKRTKGITLVSVIVTIIVLAIVTGASISLINGSGGFLNQTESAVDQYKIGEEKEALSVVQSKLYVQSSTDDSFFDETEKVARKTVEVLSENGHEAVIAEKENEVGAYIVTFKETNDVFYFHPEKGKISFLGKSDEDYKNIELAGGDNSDDDDDDDDDDDGGGDEDYVHSQKNTGDITFTSNTDKWTNQDVITEIVVKAGKNMANYTLQYCIDYKPDRAGYNKWTNYTEPIVSKQNEKIYARVFHTKTGTSSVMASKEIKNIDKVEPTVSFGTEGGYYVINTNTSDDANLGGNTEVATISTTVTVTDSPKTERNAKSDVYKPELAYIWSTETTAPESGYKSFVNGQNIVKPDCEAGKTYYLYIQYSDTAIHNGGTGVLNTNHSSSKSAAAKFVVGAKGETGIEFSNTEWNPDIANRGRITITGGYTESTLKWKTNAVGGHTSWSNFTSGQPTPWLPSGTVVYAELVDKETNKRIYSTTNILDTTKPEITLSSQKDENWSKSKSVTVTVNDDESMLASNQVFEYGWSKSKTTEPEAYQKVRLGNGETRRASFVVNGPSEAQPELEGKYYLWVIAEDVKDTVNNVNAETVKTNGQYWIDNKGPIITAASANTYQITFSATDGLNGEDGSSSQIVACAITMGEQAAPQAGEVNGTEGKDGLGTWIACTKTNKLENRMVSGYLQGQTYHVWAMDSLGNVTPAGDSKEVSTTTITPPPDRLGSAVITWSDKEAWAKVDYKTTSEFIIQMSVDGGSTWNTTESVYVKSGTQILVRYTDTTNNSTHYEALKPILKYYVAYHGNKDAKNNMATIEHTYDTSKKLSKNAFTREGYNFVKWYHVATEGTNGTKGSGDSFDDEASVLNLVEVNGTTYDMYATWKPVKTVATINGIEYALLQEAIDDVPAGTQTTIVLQNDTTENVTIPENKNVIIDMNGHTITSKSDSKPAIMVEGNASLILTGNGEVKAKSGTAIENNGNLVVQSNVKVSSESGTAIENKGNAVISGNAKVSSGTGIAINNSKTLEVKENAVVSSGGSEAAINNTGSGVTNINGGIVQNTGNGTAIANGQSGTVNINAGKVVADNGIGVDNRGNLNVKGGEVSSANGTAIDNKGNAVIGGNAKVSSNTGTAIENSKTLEIKENAVVTSNGSKPTINNKENGIINVNGGTIQNTGTGIGTAIANSENGTVNINNGKVEADSGIGVDNRGTLNVKGGEVNSDHGIAIKNESSGKANVSGGKVTTDDGTAIENVGTLSTTGGEISANGGTGINNKGNATIGGDTKINSNTGTAIENSKTLEIKENAVITSKGNSPTINNTENGTTTVKGGTVQNTGNGSAIENGKNGTVNINAGKVEADNGIGVNNNGTLNVNGGEVNSDHGKAILNGTDGKTNVNGGKVTTDNGTAIENKGTLTTKGGEISAGSGTAIDNKGNATIGGDTKINSNTGTAIENSKTLEIKENANITNNGDKPTINNKDNGTTNINGGTVQNSGNGSAIENGEHGTVNVNGGKVESDNGTGIDNKGNLNVNGGEVNSDHGTAIENENKGNTTVSGGKVTTEDGTGVENEGNLDIKGGEVSSGSGIAVDNKGTTTVEGDGKVKTEGGTGIKNENGGTSNIKGGKVSSGSGTAVDNEAGGNTNITGGNIDSESGKAIDNKGNAKIEGNADIKGQTSGSNVTITFDSKGGTAATAITKEVNSNTNFPSSTKQGYTFRGWSKDDGGTTAVAEPYKMTTDITLYAIWDDTVAPKVSNVSTTTNQVIFKATDEDGVTAYAVTTGSSAPALTSTGGVEGNAGLGKWISCTKQTEINQVLTGYTQNTTYYVWARDTKGNVSSSIYKQTATVTGVTIAITDASTWTNGNKTVKITASNTNYQKIRYTTNGTKPTATSGTEISSGGTFTATQNCTIYAIAFDSTSQAGATASDTITKIDKLAPTSVSFTEGHTTNSITVTASATDQNATTANGKSGIKDYRFSKDGGSSWTSYQTSNVYTFSSLAQTTNFSIKIEARDNALNTTQSSASTVKTNTVTAASSSNVSYSTSWSGTNATVNFTTTSGFSIQLSTNNSSWSTQSSITVATNTQIYVRYTDGTNQGSSYASYKPIKEYTVSYNSNGGSGTTSSQTKYHGTNLSLRSNGFTAPSGKHFKTWNTNSNGTGTSYAQGGTYSTNAAQTMYAIWEAHSYSSSVTTSPTCTATGVRTYRCACGDSYTATEPAYGHSYTSEDTSSTYLRTSRSCTSAQTYYYKCSRCTEKGTTYWTYQSAQGHTFTYKSTESRNLRSSATCTSAATYYYECQRCTEHGTDYWSSGSANGHTYSYGTCTYWRCTVCNATGGTSSHNYSYGTCTYWSCSRCGASGGTSTHNYSYSGCTYYKCNNCGTSGGYTSHNYGSATCTSAATCSRCGATTGSALGHNSTSATCTEPAKCSRCGAITGQALGHGNEIGQSYHCAFACPSCGEDNLWATVYRCGRCDTITVIYYLCSCGYSE